MIADFELSPEEKRFVDDSARKLVTSGYDHLCAVPEEQMMHMRGLVAAVAIAMTIGNHNLWDGGVDAILKR